MLEKERDELLAKVQKLEVENIKLFNARDSHEAKVEAQMKQLRDLLDNYQRRGNKLCQDIVPSDKLSFSTMLNIIDEEFNRLSIKIHSDMNERILAKFDQLRSYYKVLNSTVNHIHNFDRASRSHWWLQSKISNPS